MELASAALPSPWSKPADRQARVRLQRIVQRMGIAGERVVERAESLADEGGAVDVQRRALGLSDRLQLDTVAHEVLA